MPTDKDAYEYGFEQGRIKGIDELVEAIEDTYGYDYASDIKPLAEELKESNNENI